MIPAALVAVAVVLDLGVAAALARRGRSEWDERCLRHWPDTVEVGIPPAPPAPAPPALRATAPSPRWRPAPQPRWRWSAAHPA